MANPNLPPAFRDLLQKAQSVRGTPFSYVDVVALPQEMRDLATLGDTLRDLTVQLMTQKQKYLSVEADAGEVYASVRTLKELFTLLADQPGYAPGDAAAAQRRATAAPLRAQMDAICKKLESACPRLSAVSTIAPDCVAQHKKLVDDINNILWGGEIQLAAKDEPPRAKKSVDVLEAADKCKTVPRTLKAGLIAHFTHILQVASEEVLRSHHGEKLAEVIEMALDDRARNVRRSLIDACVAVGASSVGSLPGPDSAYVAFVRLRAVSQVARVLNHASLRDGEAIKLKNLLEKGLRFDDTWSEASVKGREGGNPELGALKAQFHDEFAKIDRLRGELRAVTDEMTKLQNAGPANKQTLQDLSARSERISARISEHSNNLKEKVIWERTGRIQTSPVYNWAISAVNIYMLIAKAEAAPDVDTNDKLKQFVSNASFGLAVLNAGTTAVTSVGRLNIARVKASFALMEQCASFVGDKIITPVTGVIAIVDGGILLFDFFNGDHDPWKLMIGGLEVVSGILLVVSLACSVAGPVGAALGIAAGVVQAIKAAVDLAKDAMRECIFKLIDDLCVKKLSWDTKTLILQKIGLDADLAALKSAFDASGLGVIEVDGMYGRQRLNDVYRRLDSAGISGPNARPLISIPFGVSDFRARGLSNP